MDEFVDFLRALTGLVTTGLAVGCAVVLFQSVRLVRSWQGAAILAGVAVGRTLTGFAL